MIIQRYQKVSFGILRLLSLVNNSIVPSYELSTIETSMSGNSNAYALNLQNTIDTDNQSIWYSFLYTIERGRESHI